MWERVCARCEALRVKFMALFISEKVFFVSGSWMWSWNIVRSDSCHLLWWFHWFLWIRGGRNKPIDDGKTAVIQDSMTAAALCNTTRVYHLLSDGKFDFRISKWRLTERILWTELWNCTSWDAGEPQAEKFWNLLHLVILMGLFHKRAGLKQLSNVV